MTSKAGREHHANSRRPSGEQEALARAREELAAVEGELALRSAEYEASADAMAESRRKYSELFQFAPDAYLVTTLDGTILESNAAAGQLLNAEQKFLTNKPMAVYIHPEDREVFETFTRSMAQSRESGQVHVRLVLNDGGVRHGDFSAAAARNHNGAPVALRWLVRDESERIQLEQDLREARDHMEARVAERTIELQRSNETKDEFIGLVSHELRTPLTVLRTGLSLLALRRKHLPDDKLDRLIQDMEEQAAHLANVVRNMLLLARVQLHEMPALEPVHLRHEVEAAVHELRMSAGPRLVHTRIPPGLTPVYGERDYVRQVLRNLLLNAHKYGGTGSPIEIEVKESPEGVLVCIMDRGPGVPAANLPLIFDRFYRSAEGVSQAAGAGLGLTVCKRLMEVMGGDIWAEPRDGGGLRVCALFGAYSVSEAP